MLSSSIVIEVQGTEPQEQLGGAQFPTHGPHGLVIWTADMMGSTLLRKSDRLHCGWGSLKFFSKPLNPYPTVTQLQK